MNADAFKAWYIQKQWEWSFKMLAIRDYDGEGPDGYGCLSINLVPLEPDSIFERETELLTIYGQLADGGLVAEDFAL